MSKTGTTVGQAGFFQILANYGIDRSISRQRLAQRPDRQTPAIANAAPIENDQLDIAGQGVMLQTVVTEDDIDFRMGRQKCFAGCGTLTANPDRDAGAPGKQQRFVANLLRDEANVTGLTSSPWRP
jgi:hypothetical protein